MVVKTGIDEWSGTRPIGKTCRLGRIKVEGLIRVELDWGQRYCIVIYQPEPLVHHNLGMFKSTFAVSIVTLSIRPPH